MSENPWGGAELRQITLHEPWASCIVRYGKDIENRGWKPTDAFDGFIAIHTASSKGTVDIPALHWLFDTKGHFPELFPDGEMLSRGEVRSRFRLGYVVAVARFGGTITPDGDGGEWHRQGSYGWVLKDIRAIEPLPATGGEGLLPVGSRQRRDIWTRYSAA